MSTRYSTLVGRVRSGRARALSSQAWTRSVWELSADTIAAAPPRRPPPWAGLSAPWAGPPTPPGAGRQQQERDRHPRPPPPPRFASSFDHGKAIRSSSAAKRGWSRSRSIRGSTRRKAMRWVRSS